MISKKMCVIDVEYSLQELLKSRRTVFAYNERCKFVMKGKEAKNIRRILYVLYEHAKQYDFDEKKPWQKMEQIINDVKLSNETVRGLLNLMCPIYVSCMSPKFVVRNSPKYFYITEIGIRFVEEEAKRMREAQKNESVPINI